MVIKSFHLRDSNHIYTQLLGHFKKVSTALQGATNGHTRLFHLCFSRHLKQKPVKTRMVPQVNFINIKKYYMKNKIRNNMTEFIVFICTK